MILVLVDVPHDFDERARRIDPDARIAYEIGNGRALVDAEIIVGRPDVEDLARAGNLRWLQLSSAGANRYVGKIREDVVLTTASGVYGVPAAEHVFAMMLGLVRAVPKAVRSAANAEWDRDSRHDELDGRTCGVLGLGDIGLAVAKRAAAFGMRVIALKRSLENPPRFVEELFERQGLHDLLARSDHVVNTLPDTPHTYHLIDAEALSRMKAGSYFYNVGRGRTVDEAALIDALKSRRLAGAGLDVFEDEPLPQDSPLWGMENVIITPHVAGSSPRENERVANLFLRNLERWIAGRSLLNVVDRSLGY